MKIIVRTNYFKIEACLIDLYNLNRTLIRLSYSSNYLNCIKSCITITHCMRLFILSRFRPYSIYRDPASPHEQPWKSRISSPQKYLMKLTLKVQRKGTWNNKWFISSISQANRSDRMQELYRGVQSVTFCWSVFIFAVRIVETVRPPKSQWTLDWVRWNVHVKMAWVGSRLTTVFRWELTLIRSPPSEPIKSPYISLSEGSISHAM